MDESAGWQKKKFKSYHCLVAIKSKVPLPNRINTLQPATTGSSTRYKPTGYNGLRTLSFYSIYLGLNPLQRVDEPIAKGLLIAG